MKITEDVIVNIPVAQSAF